MEQKIREILESPRRIWIVIIATFVLGLATILPLADMYADVEEQKSALAEQLQESRMTVEHLAVLRERVQRRRADLETAQARGISGEAIPDFRERVMMLVRDAGCEIRRLEVGSPRLRDWHRQDDPLLQSPRIKNKKTETGLQLHSQSLLLTVSGSLQQVQEFLDGLHQTGKFYHTQHFSLRPTGAQRNEVTLEMELRIFDLRRAAPVTT